MVKTSFNTTVILKKQLELLWYTHKKNPSGVHQLS